jgi:hypothetical protein
MLIIIDHKIPSQAKDKLSAYGQVLELKTAGITYDAISGHPDIFLCRTPAGLIAAPNTPPAILEKLKAKGVAFRLGENDVGIQYPRSAIYNAVVTGNHYIHNKDITDPAIFASLEDQEQINVRQGYTRCSLLPLKDGHFISSDIGIHQTLKKNGMDVLLVDPAGIVIHDLKHGFIGGACGVHEDKVFIIGSLKHFGDGKLVRSYIKNLGYQIIELYDGPLYDGGSIMF